jgi:hypothetical protein
MTPEQISEAKRLIAKRKPLLTPTDTGAMVPNPNPLHHFYDSYASESEQSRSIQPLIQLWKAVFTILLVFGIYWFTKSKVL